MKGEILRRHADGRVTIRVAVTAILLAGCTAALPPTPQVIYVTLPPATATPASTSSTQEPTATAAPTAGALVIEGRDNENSAPFDLAAGDYRIEWRVTTDASSVRENECHLLASLATPEDPLAHDAGGGSSLPAGTSEGDTYAYGVESGRHYMRVAWTCPGPWSFTITRVP